MFIFGWASWLLVFAGFYFGLRHLGVVDSEDICSSRYARIFSLVIMLVSLSLILGLQGSQEARFMKAGVLGFFLSDILCRYIGFWGSLILGIVLFIGSGLIFWGYFVVDSFVYLGKRLVAVKQAVFDMAGSRNIAKAGIRAKNKKIEVKIYDNSGPAKPEPAGLTAFKPKQNLDAGSSKPPVKNKTLRPEAEPVKAFQDDKYKIPGLNVFKDRPFEDDKEARESIKANAVSLEDVLSDFGISVKVVSVQRGPVVTRYELLPSAGIKINRISALADDIALTMKAASVRVAPIPGKGTVGVEVPNRKKNIVFLKDVISDRRFQSSRSLLTLALGKDVAGSPLVADLKEMPHLLIAGTTGSGKTVCVNSIICSMLMKARPSDVKFILVDPKMVELAHFGGIPHLISPIISDAKKASDVLLWATEEMGKRYSILAEEGARNIDIYNSRSKEKLPFIVIVVDELADLMVIARDKIETAILRLAQLSRAVGIHLVLATQRPSVDVITGVIKANFPARISFKVASKIDSRTVLDFVGAEKLLGKGDMLFIRPGLVKPIRAQACYVDDDNIVSLVNSVKAYGAPEYNQQIMDLQKKSRTGSLGSDELLPDAIKIVLESGQASASIIQRRLRVGYTRAARLLDLMEEKGIVGAFQGSKAREILVDRQKWLLEQN